MYIVGGDGVKSRSPASFVWPGGSVAVKVGGDRGQGAHLPLWPYLPVPPAFALCMTHGINLQGRDYLLCF